MNDFFSKNFNEVVYSFIGVLFIILGYLLKTWKEKIEKDIENKVAKDICEKEHEKHDERFESVADKIEELENVNKDIVLPDIYGRRKDDKHN